MAASQVDYAVGIDLGTTNSCVGVWKNETVEIVANAMGERTTPSYVSFVDEGEAFRVIGKTAKKKAARNPENTVFDSKRILGKSFNDDSLQEDLQRWPFRVIEGENGKPLIQVSEGGEQKTFFPEEISALVLQKMKQTAEASLGIAVEQAVITVPAYFNEAQRQATIDAARLAEIHVLRTLSEPTAAAYAYGLQECTEDENKTVLVFDLGGGTLDVSILSIGNNVLEVLSVAGDPHLGGQDFDNRVMDNFIKDFKRKEKIDIRNNHRAKRKLKTEVEKAKRVLSTSPKATVEVDSLCEGVDFHASLSRAKFESVCSREFRRCLVPVEEVLRNSNLNKEDIDEIILVGGSSKMPKVQKLLKTFFDGKPLRTSVDPDEAVAFGATAYAHTLTNKGIEEEEDMIIVDVLPISIGIECQGGMMCKIIPRNQTLPCEASMDFTTIDDCQRMVLIKVYEGERATVKDNRMLGKFWIKGLADLPRGVPKIELTFKVNEDGILNVVAREKTSGIKKQYQIQSSKGNLTEDDIQLILNKAKDNAYEDEQSLERNEIKNLLTSTIYGIKNELARHISELDDYVEELIQWLEENESGDTVTFQDKFAEVREFLQQQLTTQDAESVGISMTMENPLQEVQI